MLWCMSLMLLAGTAFDGTTGHNQQTCGPSTTAEEQSGRPVGLGRSIHINRQNLLGSELDMTGLSIFEALPDHCIRTEPSFTSSRKFVYYKNTKTLYTSLTTSSSLDASLQRDFTLGFTLDTASKGISSSSRTVTGNSMLIMAGSSRVMVDEDCFYSEQLSEALMNDLNTLPPKITAPWQGNAWHMYDVFLRKYGSHVMASTTLGSSINQMAWADTSKSYTERDFQVKSCVKLAAPTEVGKLNVSLCANVSQEEVSKVENMEMTDMLTITGGSNKTRAALLNQRTEALIEQFMNEANTSASPILYAYKPIWDILQSRFAGVSNDNFLRTVNLEYYYLGFLNYGCPYLHQSGQEMQAFNFSAGSTPDMPQYECTLAPTGCHSDDDCHYHVGVWCSCRGESCVHYKDTTLDTGGIKTTAYMNTYWSWGWHGCDWKHWGGMCLCKHESHQRLTVWSADNKNALYAAHYISMRRAGRPAPERRGGRRVQAQEL